MQKHLANFITLIGIALGVAAIVMAIRGDAVIAMVLILGSALIDRYDGIVARKLESVTTLGCYLDTINDVISFAIAPAILLYTANLFFLNIIVIFVLTLYVASGLYRLYRFHKEGDLINYKGLPITLGASLIIFVIAWFMYINQVNLYSDIIIAAIIVFIAYAMSCTITITKR